MKRSVNGSTALRQRMALLYDYFHGANNNVYSTLFDSFNIDVNAAGTKQELNLPVIMMNISNIQNKVNSLIGDLIDMGFESHVDVINAEAKSRKLAAKQAVLAQMSIQPLMELAAIESGISVGMQDQLPESAEQAEKFFKHNYKDNSELVMEACLRYSLQYAHYTQLRIMLAYDAIIAGECHCQTLVSNGVPIFKRWNPLNTYYAVDINDDQFLSKTIGIGHVFYASRSDVMSRFKLTNEEIEKDLTAVQGQDVSAFLGVTQNGNYIFTPYQNNTDMILVSEWQWIDEKKVLGMTITDKDGNESFEILYGEDADKKYSVPKEDKEKGLTYKFERKIISWPRKATLIGGTILKDWGELECQVRYPDDLSYSQMEVTSYRPTYMQGKNTSLVDRLGYVQDFKNYVWTRIQLELTKSSGKLVAFDTAKLPPDWGDGANALKTLVYYMKSTGVVLYNSNQGEVPGQNGIPIQEVDNGLGSAIAGYVSMLQLIDAEMDDMSGINDARMGNIQSANQLASVTAMALQQSNKVTKGFFDGFFQFESNLLTKHARQIRHTWVLNPKRWSPVIGDLYMQFLENDIVADPTMDDFGVWATNNAINRQDLNAMLMAALQTGAITPHAALKIQMAAKDDIKMATRDYIDMMEKREKEQAERQAQMEEAQMQMQAQAEQAKAQTTLQNTQMNNDAQLQERQMKDQTDLQKTQMKEGNKRYLEEQKNKLEGNYPLYTR